MHLLPSDQRPLGRSLELAEAAAAFASPNPTVGCVLALQDGALAEGAHYFDERDHAEIAALKAARQAGHDVHGATAFVTLEPCSHHGRTGPCADALIAAGIRRCVVATVDPNPLVKGAGLAKLQAAGVQVDLLDPTTEMAQQARRLNDAFGFSVVHGRPFVTLKVAVSRDGKIAPHPAKRVLAAPFWLTGPAAREDVQHLRYCSDAILTGIGTVLADDPALTDRTGLPRRKALLRVVLDSELRMPIHSRLVQSAEGDLLLFTTEEAPREPEKELRANGVQVVRLPAMNGRLELGLVLGFLAAIPVRSLLVEAGSTLNESLLEQNLVDKVVTYTAPVELGPEALPFAQTFTVQALKASLLLPQEKRFANGNAADLRVAGYLHDPWSEV